MKIRPLSSISLIHNSIYQNNSETLKDDMQKNNNFVAQLNNCDNIETNNKQNRVVQKIDQVNIQMPQSSQQGSYSRKGKTVQKVNTQNLKMLNCIQNQKFIDSRILNSIASINLITSQRNKIALKLWEQYEKTINDSFLEQNQQSQLNNISYTINKLNTFAIQQIERSVNINLVQRILNSCFSWLDFFGTLWMQKYINQTQSSIVQLQNSHYNSQVDYIYFSQQQQNDQVINITNFPIVLNETILLLKVLTMNNQGTVLRRKGQFQAALEIFNEALNIIHCARRKEYLGLTYLNLSILYSSLGNHNLSLENANNSLIEQQKLFFEKNYISYNERQINPRDKSQSPQQIRLEKQQNNSSPNQQVQPNIRTTKGFNDLDLTTIDLQYKLKSTKNTDNTLFQNSGQQGKNNNVSINFSDLYFYKEEREEEFLFQVNTLTISYYNIAAEMEYFQRWEEAFRYYEYSYICAQKYFGDDNCVTLQFYEEFKLFQSRQVKLKFDSNFHENRRIPSSQNVKRSFSYHKERSTSNHKNIKPDSFCIKQFQISRLSSKNTTTTKESEKEQIEDIHQSTKAQKQGENSQKMNKLKTFMQSQSPKIKISPLKGRHKSLHLNLNKVKYENNVNRTPLYSNNNSLQQSLMFYQNSIDQIQQNSKLFQTQAQNKSQFNFSSQTPSNLQLSSSTTNNSKKNMFSSFLKKSSNSLISIFTPKGINNKILNNQSNIDQQQQNYQMPQFLSQNSSGNQLQLSQSILSPFGNQNLVHSLLNSPKQMIQTQSVKNFTTKNQSHINLNTLQIQKQVLNQNINKKVPLIDRIQQFGQLNKQRFQTNQFNELKNGLEKSENNNQIQKQQVIQKSEFPQQYLDLNNFEQIQTNSSLNQDKIEQNSTTANSKNNENATILKRYNELKQQMIQQKPYIQDDLKTSESQNIERESSNKQQYKLSSKKDNKSFQKTLTQSSPSSPIYQDFQSYKQYLPQNDVFQQEERSQSLNDDNKPIKDNFLKKNNTSKLKQIFSQKNETETKQIRNQLIQKKKNEKQKNDDPLFFQQNTESEKSFENNGGEDNEQEDSFWNNQNLNGDNFKNQNKKNNKQKTSTAMLKQKLLSLQQSKKDFLRQRSSLPNLQTQQDVSHITFNQIQKQIYNRNQINHDNNLNQLQNLNSNQQNHVKENKRETQQPNQIQLIYRTEKKKLNVFLSDNLQTTQQNFDKSKEIAQQLQQKGSLSFTLVEQIILIASYNLNDKKTDEKYALLHSLDVSKVKQFLKNNHPINNSQYSSTTNLSKKEDGSDNQLEEYISDEEMQKGQQEEECKSVSLKTVTLNSSQDYFRDILNQFSKQISNYFLISPNKQYLLIDFSKSLNQSLRIPLKNICTFIIQKISDDKSIVHIVRDDAYISQEEQNIQDNQNSSQIKKMEFGYGNKNSYTLQRGIKDLNINHLQGVPQQVTPQSSFTSQTLATPISSIVLSSPKSAANLIGHGSNQNLQMQPSQSTHQLALEQIDELEELKPIIINKLKKGDKISHSSFPKETDLIESSASSISPIFTQIYNKSKKSMIYLPQQNSNNQIDRKDSFMSVNPIMKQIQDCSPINEIQSPFVSPNDQDPTFTNYLKYISPTIKEYGNHTD